MSPVLLTALVVGQVALVVAGYALSRLVQELQVDARRAGAIIDRPERRVPVARPPELEALERLTADALASPAAAAEIHRLMADLGRRAPGGPVAIIPPGRRARPAWLAANLTELERAWGLPPRPT